MKKAALCAALALVAGSAFAKEWKTVRVGVDASYPPFESTAPSGEIVGFDVDLTKEICKRINVKCVWVAQDLDGIIPALKAKKYDVIVSSLTVTDKRREQIDFSDKVYDAPARMIAKTGSPLLPTVASLKGSAWASSRPTQETYAKAYWEPQGVTIIPYQNWMGLRRPRLGPSRRDAAGRAAGRLRLPAHAARQGFAFAGPEVKDPKTIGDGTAIGLRKEDTDLKLKINQALADMHKDGTYDRLSHKYFAFSVYSASAR